MVRRAFIAALIAFAPALAFAQEGNVNTPRIDRRQVNQEHRIDQGIEHGGLTGREARRLQAEQNRIDRVENRARADGTVTRRERVHLTRMQNRASRDIYRQRHDRQRRG